MLVITICITIVKNDLQMFIRSFFWNGIVPSKQSTIYFGNVYILKNKHPRIRKRRSIPIYKNTISDLKQKNDLMKLKFEDSLMCIWATRKNPALLSMK